MSKQSVSNNTQLSFEFQGLDKRRFVTDFEGGNITSDGGAVLLREVDQRLGICERLADCFMDYREKHRIDHSIVELLRQRIFGIALGYEDLNDHDELRTDPGYAAIVGKSDPTGSDRSRDRDRGYALAGSSTLNRFELGSEDGSASNRYRKIVGEFSEIEDLVTELSLEQMALEGAPPVLFIDADATDDPLHGRQEGRFFHGYYDSYCYLPLYIFAGGRSVPTVADIVVTKLDRASSDIPNNRHVCKSIELRTRNIV